LENVNWTWGLSLIALTTAIHAMGVVMMAFVGLTIKARLETRKLGLRHVIPIVIGIVGVVGLLLAVLHGIEAAVWGRRIFGLVRWTRLKMRSSILSTR
jgi:hypothetical protein